MSSSSIESIPLKYSPNTRSNRSINLSSFTKLVRAK